MNVFFTLKLKTTSLFPTVCLCAVPYFIKTSNTVKWGKKIDFRNWHRKYVLWYIKRFLFYLWLKITHKTKIEGHLCPQGSKIGLKTPKNGFETKFSTPEGTMASNFCFHVWFLISDKIKSVWYITRRIFCANFANFYEIRYCA